MAGSDVPLRVSCFEAHGFYVSYDVGDDEDQEARCSELVVDYKPVEIQDADACVELVAALLEHVQSCTVARYSDVLMVSLIDATMAAHSPCFYLTMV